MNTVIALSADFRKADSKDLVALYWLQFIALEFLTLRSSGKWSCLIYSFLHSPVTSSLLAPNILLNTLKGVEENIFSTP